MVWGLLRRSSAWGSRNGILGSGPTVRPSEIESEVPPGVMAAIVSTRGSDVRDSRDHGGLPLGGVTSTETHVVPMAAAPNDEDGEWTVVTEAGEVRKKARKDAPWIQVSNVDRLSRGSAELALSIARNDARSQRAIANFETLVYASGTSASKNSMFELWTKICRARGWQPLPVTCDAIGHVAAIMREAGFKSVSNYLYEAKDRHSRAGYHWSPQMTVALNDAKRAAKRAVGFAKRSDEVRPELWQQMVDVLGNDPHGWDASPEAPAGGVAIWCFGTAFMLREVELGSLVLDSETVEFTRVPKRAVSLRLSSSKTDPGGKGVKRTLACNCNGSFSYTSCPYHMAEWLVNLQLARLNFDALEEVPVGSVPLIAQRRCPCTFVSKGAMIAEAQRHISLLKGCVAEARLLQPELTTGHFMRRSGAKMMARKGCSFPCIQWFARHSSSVTWIYVEEAWSESPKESWRMSDEMAMMDLLNDALTRVSHVEEAINIAEEKFLQGFKVLETAENDMSRIEFRREVRAALIPEYVINLAAGRVHVVSKGSCLEKDPRFWTTRCGWTWLRSGQACKPVFDDDETDVSDFDRCLKCFATEL